MSHTIITVRLTADNIDTVFRPGDAFTDDPTFGIVKSARLGFRGDDYAMIYNTGGMRDQFGLPQTVRITRVAI